jgi:hypothetical protein
MPIHTNKLESLATSRGLYCVWAPTREGEATSLVARWIDPKTEVREGDNCNSNISEVAREMTEVG